MAQQFISVAIYEKNVEDKAFITGAFQVLNLREANIKISCVYKKGPEKQ